MTREEFDDRDHHDLGEGPLVLSEDRADLLRESIKMRHEEIDGILDEFHELESEYEEYQRHMAVRLWMNRLGFLLAGIAAAWVIGYV